MAVVKVTISVWWIAVHSFHFPTRAACPSEVQPKATACSRTIFPVFAIFSLSSIIRGSSLYAASGLFQVTVI